MGPLLSVPEVRFVLRARAPDTATGAGAAAGEWAAVTVCVCHACRAAVAPAWRELQQQRPYNIPARDFRAHLSAHGPMFAA